MQCRRAFADSAEGRRADQDRPARFGEAGDRCTDPGCYGAKVQGLQGRAGSGKTSLLSLIREGAKTNGYAVEGFAPTSRAAKQLRDAGIVDSKDHSMCVLAPRNDMTGADREWASRYEPGDVLHSTRGSKEHGIESRSYARIVSTDPKENFVTVQKQDGQQVTYDPSRLRGIAACREIEREFALGDKIQFAAPQRDLRVANRDLDIIQSIGDDGKISVRMHGTKDRIVRFDADRMRHFDHGYAVTSHSSQGLTSERVLVGMDTEVHPELMSNRFAYVSASRASHEVQVFTNDAANLAESLSRDVSKTTAVSFGKEKVSIPGLAPEQSRALHNTPAVGLGLAL